MIKLTNVTKKYKKSIAINNLNLELPSTGLVILQGINGAGKSTLLNLIGATDIPTEGTIEVDGDILTSMDEKQLCAYRENNIAFIFQNGNLFENMTVEENINIVGKGARFDDIIELLDLKDLLNKKARELSGGEKSRVGIARAILKDAKILIADEPTAAIDPESKKLIFEMLSALSKMKLVIASSHEKAIIENYGDLVVTLHEGKVTQMTTKTPGGYPLLAEGHKNEFAPIKFTFKNFFANKARMARSCTLMILSFLFIFIATSLMNLDYIEMQADTMFLENDTKVTFQKSSGEMTEEDISNLENELAGRVSTGKKINVGNEYIKLDIDYATSRTLSEFYTHQVSEMTFYSIADCQELIAGSMPTAQNEIIVTSYLADMMIERGVKDMTGSYYKPSNYDELLTGRHELDLEGLPVIVTGIAKINLDKYETIKTSSDYYLQNLESSYLEQNADHIYVRDEFFDMFIDYKPALDKNYIIVSSPGYEEDGLYHQGNELTFSILEEPVVLKNTETNVEYLRENEVIVNGRAIDVAKTDPENPTGRILTLYFENKNDHTVSEPIKFRVVGTSSDNNSYMSLEAMRPYIVKPFITEKVEYYAKDKSELTNILRKYMNGSDYILNTTYMFRFEDIEKYCKLASLIAGGLGVALGILAILFIKSYTSNSAEEHKKDVAILKSLGILNKDIIPMFIIENSVIIFASFLASLLAFLAIRPIVSIVGNSFFAFQVNLLPIEAMYILGVFGICLLIDVVFTILAVKKFQNIPPQQLFRINSV